MSEENGGKADREALIGKGLVLLEAGRLQEARDCLLQALAEGASGDVHLLLSQVASGLGETAAAVDHVLEAGRLAPELLQADSLVNLAAQLEGAGELARAAAVWEQLVAQAREPGDKLLKLAGLYARLGRFDRCRDLIGRRGRQARPQLRALERELAALAADLAQLIPLLENQEQRQLLHQAQQLAGCGRLKEAVDQLAPAPSAGGSHGQLFQCALGRLLVCWGRLSLSDELNGQAVVLLAQGAAGAQVPAWAVLWLARALLKQGQSAQATESLVATLTQAAVKTGCEEEVQAELVCMYLQGGNRAAAEAHLQQYVNLLERRTAVSRSFAAGCRLLPQNGLAAAQRLAMIEAQLKGSLLHELPPVVKHQLVAFVYQAVMVADLGGIHLEEE